MKRERERERERERRREGGREGGRERTLSVLRDGTSRGITQDWN